MQTVSWINSAGGDWTTGSDWSTGVVPGPGDDVAIDASGTYTVTINSDQTVLSLGVAASATVAITSGSSLTVTGGAGASVSAGATLSVGTGSSLDLSSPLSVAGTLANAGAVSGGGATAVTFASSTDRLILDPGAAFTGALVGGGANTTLELANGSGAGTLNALGTSFTDFGAVTVDPGATWTVDALASALAGMTITGNGGSNLLEMISAGAFSLGEISQFPTVNLAAGNNTVTVTDTTLSGGLVTIEAGATGNETISAAGDTAASEGKTLAYYAATGTDSFTGGFENDSVHVSATAVGGDTLTGGSGANTLVLSSAGSVNLGGVSRFATIYLAAGSNTVTVTDAALSGGLVAIKAGASGNETISAAGDTAASEGKTLAYYAATGTDSFTGGFENDSVHVSAPAVGGDTLTGGSGANALVLSSAGSVNLGGVSRFDTIYLVAGNNNVTVTDSALSGGPVALHDGTSGNNIVNVMDTAISQGTTLYYVTGTGIDHFTGEFENDTVYVSAAVVSGDTLTGGSGKNVLVLTSAGTFRLAGVSHFPTIYLAAGNNTVYASTEEASSERLIGGSGTNVLVLTSAGTVDLGGVSNFANIYLAAGNSTVTLTSTTLSGGPVALHDGPSGNNRVNIADTAASKGATLYYVAGETETDSFIGGFENDTIYIAGGAALGRDMLTGGSGTNALVMTSASTVNLARVSEFPNIYLAAGNNEVRVTDTTLSGGSVAVHDGTSGTNNVSAAGDTAASKGKTLYYVTATGAHNSFFTGGFENDTVSVSATAVGGDKLTGGSGVNALVMTSAGTVILSRVSKFANIYLAAGNNTVTVTDATLSGGSVALRDGASGNNTVSVAGDTAASKGETLYYVAGTGTDSFTGGFENDTVYAGSGNDTIHAGSGNDTIFAGTGLGAFTAASSGSDKFVFIADNLPTQTIDNFRVSADDLVVYGIDAPNGFDLGSTDNALNPLAATAIDPAIFIANASGSFTSAGQRFAYDTTNGDLFYSATGSNTSETTVATLTGAPALTASNILFQH